MPAFLRWRTVVGTAAAALGAAILVANSPWMIPKRRPYNLTVLGNAMLKRLDGTPGVVAGKDLWHQHGAVVMVVRRPG